MEVIKKVLLADTGEEFRRNLAERIGGESDLCVVGQTGDGRELLKLIDETTPDVIVMDMILTGIDGLEVLDELNKRPDAPQVIIFFQLCPRKHCPGGSRPRGGLLHYQTWPERHDL